MNKPNNNHGKPNKNNGFKSQARNHSGKGNLGQQQKRSVADAPYNFIPLSEKVVFSESRVSQDRPLKNGISGIIELRIKTLTPLTVGGDRRSGTENQPGFVSCSDMKTSQENGKREFLIPGTSLKGMIRSIFEVISFSKMQQVEEKRFGIRDLQFEHYQKRFAKSKHDGKNMVFHSKVKTGWIKFEGSTWHFEPCCHWRIEQDDLLNTNLIKNQSQEQWQEMKRMPAKKKYNLINPQNLKVSFNATQPKAWPHSGKQMFYAKLTQLNGGDTEGYVVITGQPGDKCRKNFKTGKYEKKRNVKHMEFVFEAPTFTQVDDSKKVQELVAQFLSTYKETDEFKTLSKFAKNGQMPAIPVFFLEEEGQLHSFGLSQLYKLAADYSVHDTIKAKTPNHFSQKVDLTESLFGYIRDDSSDTKQKGRVSFGHFKSTNAQTEITKRTVLLGPRATYYPFYLEQPANQLNQIDKKDWVSYLKPIGSGKDQAPVSRGRKIYPVKNLWIPDPPQNIRSEKTVVKLEHVMPGAEFVGKIRLHNLSEHELGGLIWALTVNGEETVHQLGMAKSFGFGQVKITMTEHHLIPNDLESGIKTLEEYKTLFEQYMAKNVENWQTSEQINGLKTSLDKQKVQNFSKQNDMSLQHMTSPQDFVKLKGDKGRFDRRAQKQLPPTPGKVLPSIAPIKQKQNRSDNNNLASTVELKPNNPFDQLKK